MNSGYLIASALFTLCAIQCKKDGLGSILFSGLFVGFAVFIFLKAFNI